MINYAKASPEEVRKAIRRELIKGPTAGMAAGHIQANLAVVPRELAFDFLLFAQRNPKACPILDVTEPGSPEPKIMAPGADIRTDIPRYRIYEHGELTAEVTDVTPYWRDDLVGFLIGCSFSFEAAMMNAGISIRHIEAGCNVPMYRTSIPCTPAGALYGNMVVSMRPIRHEQVVRAVQVTSRYPSVHGAPVHIGDPSVIGIADVSNPDFGDAVEIKAGEVPVFWACGVTPQSIAMTSKPPFMITHAPGHMFVCNPKDEDLAAF